MKRLLNLSKFEVGITFIPFVIIILLSGYYKLFFTYFLITLIHELSHVIMAVFFKVKVEKIKLNVFGFSADIEDIDYLDIFKQILIIIAGPLSYFISNIVVKELYLSDTISLLMYYKAIASNKYILLFNLLPIYPLDGGRLLKILNNKLFTYKKAKIITYLVSFVFIFGFVFYTMECKQYLMYLFLMINFIINVLSLKKEWKLFLTKRYYFKNLYKKTLHNKKDLFIYKNNYILKDNDILTEKEAIIEMLKE